MVERSAGYSIGVDVGGTFTDCIIFDESDETVEVVKVPSRPDRPDQAVLHGVGRLLEMDGADPAAVRHFCHGTTLATNTVIAETGVRVGLITTRGFGDVLFLRRLRFPDPTNINGPLPRHLVSRQDVREIEERVSAAGEVITPLDLEAVVAAVRELREKRGVEAIAISFIHSYRNDVHEVAAKAAIEAHFPDLFVCSSSDVWPRPREYERTLVAVMNAYVGQRTRRYLTGLGNGVRDMGIPAPVLVTRSNGGIMNVETAGQYPVQTMLSGPAAGVVGGLHFAKLAGFDRIVTWDMGGTSLDVSMIDGRLPQTDSARIGDYPLFLPTVDILSVGAGGGSLGWVDASGLLHVGPRSAGADPGPACYGRGGEQATLTDAYLTLGIIDPKHFAAGELELKPELAAAALTRLGTPLGLDAVATADAMVSVATAQIHSQFMPLLARYAVEPSEFALFPYGGAGPTHCFLFARSFGFQRVVVPLFPGLLCAWGSIIADLRFDVPRSIDVDLDRLDAGEFNRQLAEMSAQARDWMDRQGVPVHETLVFRQAHVRYKGQSFEVETALPAGHVEAAGIKRAFIDAYRGRYGYADEEAPLEVISAVVQAVGVTTKPERAPQLKTRATGSGRGSRRVYLDGAWREVTAVERAALAAGDVLAGPVVIDQPDTTTLVPAGFTVRVDEHLNLVGERDS